MVSWLLVARLAVGEIEPPVLRGVEHVVRVVDVDGTPVVGAWVVSVATSSNREPSYEWFEAIARWVAVGGTGEPPTGKEWRRTSADGTATVEPLDVLTHVVALTPTVGGGAGFAFGQEDATTLIARPHRFWRVAVVDPARPDRPLQLAVEFGVEGDLADRASFFRLASVWPGPDGVASFGPVDVLLEANAIGGGDAPPHDLTLAARLDYPGSPRRRLRCRASQVENSSAALELPPTAMLEVEVVDRAGKRIEAPREVAITVDTRRPLWSKGWLNSDLGTWTRTTVGGVARFDHVGIAAPLILELGGRFNGVPTGQESDPDDQRGDLSGFAQAGETRLRTLVEYQPCRSLLVRGRCIDGARAPLQSRPLRWLLVEPESGGSRLVDHGWGVEGTCDAGGRFEQELVVGATAAGGAELVLLDLGRDGSRDADPLGFATVSIGELASLFQCELGDVVFTPLPRLAGGRCVDEQGAPLASAFVSLSADRDQLDAHTTRPRWWSTAWQTTVTGPDGRYEFRGFAPELPRTVGASAFGRRSIGGHLIESPKTELIVPLPIGSGGRTVAPHRRPRAVWKQGAGRRGHDAPRSAAHVRCRRRPHDAPPADRPARQGPRQAHSSGRSHRCRDPWRVRHALPAPFRWADRRLGVRS